MDNNAIDVLLSKVKYFTKNYPSKELILTPLSFTSQVGIILEGNVLVYKNILIGDQFILNHIHTGGIIGMSSICENQKEFPAFVQAYSDCKILFLPKASLFQLFSLHPPILEHWLEMMSSRIHYLTDKIEMLAIPSAKDRLLWFIEHHTNNFNSSIKLSKTDLMHHLSISHASLYRAISKLESEGYIKRNTDGSISIVIS